MERPTTEINLPISGMKAVVYGYFTRGERKAIEAVMLESAVFENVGDTPKLKSIDATYRAKMEDKTVLLAVKNLVDKEGKTIKCEQSVLDGLPDGDFETLRSAIESNQPKKK